MAVLEIVKAGQPVLKQTAEPVEFVNKAIKKLLDDMAETMYAAGGVGLAAPQVNESKRMLVCDDGTGLLELINPVIVKAEGTQTGTEGCLSIPGYYGDVERFERIVVEAINRNNKKITVRAEGFKARIIQHEIDHLDGILFIEKALSLHKETVE